MPSLLRRLHLYLRSLPLFNNPFHVSEERRAAFYALFEDMARPGIRMQPHDAAAVVDTGGSKLGGLPDLPAYLDWPCEAGRPLAFVAQVNLAEVAPWDTRHELPPKGLLLFFYDLGNHEGGRVLYLEPGVPLVRTPFPDALGKKFRLPERAVVLTPVAMPPHYLSEEEMAPCNALCGGDKDLASDTYCELRAEYVGYAYADDSSTFLLGQPDTIQGALAEEDGVLLFQLASFEDARGSLQLGDGGNAYFLIHERDLAARDFSKVRVVMQCY